MSDIRTVLHIQCGQPIFLFCGDPRYLYKLDKSEIMSFEGANVPDEHVAVCNQCGGLLKTNDLFLKSEPTTDSYYYDECKYRAYYNDYTQKLEYAKQVMELQQQYLSPQQLQQYKQQMQLNLDEAAYDTFKTQMLQSSYSGRKADFTIIDDKTKL